MTAVCPASPDAPSLRPGARLSARRWLALALLAWGILSAAGCGPAGDPVVGLGVIEPDALLPARIRRLSIAEFENTAAALLGGPVEVASRLPPDVRQSGYTQNASQPFPTALGTSLSRLSVELAEQAVAQRQAALLPCERGDRPCLAARLEELATRAFRRPPSQAELDALSSLYAKGASLDGSKGGLVWVLSALLQSPSLWYLDESGVRGRGSARVALDDWQLASSLAYTVSGAPPDRELLASAEAGRLSDAEERARQARRLLGKPETRHHFRRFVLEWLEVDQLEATVKDVAQHPTYDAVKGAMLEETAAFVDEVMVHRGASVRSLLDAGFGALPPIMARYYGLGVYGPRVPLEGTGRRGVLQQASFLSAHAHPDSSSPVKRGDFVLRKVLCSATPRPRELDLEIVIPPPAPGQTTRARFSRHQADPACAFCHERIDGFGNSFEAFDAAGRTRTHENGKPIDTRVRFRMDGATLAFEDSTEVSAALARDARTQECFWRNAFRFFTAGSEPAVEAGFLTLTRSLPKERQESLVDALVAFVASDLFLLRTIRDEAR